MTPEKLFHELLGLGLNWEVIESRFQRESGTVFLEIRETSRLWRMLFRQVDAAYAEADFSHVCCVGVDELSVRRGHEYVSGFADLVRKRVLFATEGKDHQVWLNFVAALEKHKGHRHAVTQVSLDMSPAYQKGVKETCRNAQRVFDKFHVIAHANKAVDEVRRAEVRLGGAGVWEALRQSQWLWRKNPENLSEPEAARLARIDQKSLRTAKAYQMRLVLQDIYRSPPAAVARQRFRVWSRWVRWVARQQPKHLLRAMVKVADLVEKHLAGILAHWKWGLTNAFMEGLNSVFSATKRKARGYRSTTHLTTMLSLVAGKLRLPQF
jgi:transposase